VLSAFSQRRHSFPKCERMPGLQNIPSRANLRAMAHFSPCYNDPVRTNPAPKHASHPVRSSLLSLIRQCPCIGFLCFDCILKQRSPSLAQSRCTPREVEQVCGMPFGHPMLRGTRKCSPCTQYNVSIPGALAIPNAIPKTSTRPCSQKPCSNNGSHGIALLHFVPSLKQQI